MEGYNARKAYIATQGPKDTTVNDFWRMIWQENAIYIVMLANVVEGGKKKSVQYWPNAKECMKFGNIKVEYCSSRVFADYEHRILSVTKDDVKRTVEQLHFTSWPDHGVPLYAQILVPLLRKILAIPQGTSPIVVHCSAGVGRTGTIILCDLCLRTTAREGIVDVLKHQHNLREQRANLVDNFQQYKLAHLVLLECLVTMRTSITCDEKAESMILQLLESERLQQQMQYIDDTAWQDAAMRPAIEITAKPEWPAKNIFQDGEHSDVNAVEVDGFRCPQQFIVTQQPLKETVSEFWKMIDEKEITTIVSLNKVNLANETSCIFWPTAKVNEIHPVPYLKIQFHNKVNSNYYNTITIHIYNANEKKSNKRIVKLIVLKEWDASKSIPDSENSLLSLWKEIERLGRGDSPIVVTCYDGIKACGLFIALSFVIEKIKLEQECDVCLAVRTVRRNQKQFVTEMEQLVFLYQAAICYLRSFYLYSNFTTGKL
ncbi:hypothetical protein ILUMI_21485 [Ignelater luminosus]|uniref:protein-tyrosine-phosphatase n=1 Tax=Ignelater luminosus TaxID=2038154 RepID=A0A8K0CHN2_IGNLU|nr:hypothetical protein ILUMI_21485 [Ignelater luminosus]